MSRSTFGGKIHHFISQWNVSLLVRKIVYLATCSQEKKYDQNKFWNTKGIYSYLI